MGLTRMPLPNPSRPARRASLFPVLALLLVPAAESWSAEVTKVGGDQKRAVEQYLDAVASGNPQAVAMAIHADDIEALRTRVMDMLRAEAKNGDNTIRSRLFGPGLPLAEIERYTAINVYAAIARKLFLTGRNYSDANYLAAIADRNGVVQVVLRAEQPREGGKARVEVVNTVAIKPWGKDWKAAMPSEVEAQIEDLIAGRRTTFAMVPRGVDRNPPPVAVASTNGSAAPASPEGGATLPGIVNLLEGAEKALTEGNCELYYKEQMSPNFRRVTSKKAMEALIASCKNSMATKEMLLTTVRIVRNLQPRFEYQGQRATYDLSGQGLPYESFALEQVNKKWFIAE
jgi:hypothetical protein